jgi:hypothetical protein
MRGDWPLRPSGMLGTSIPLSIRAQLPSKRRQDLVTQREQGLSLTLTRTAKPLIEPCSHSWRCLGHGTSKGFSLAPPSPRGIHCRLCQLRVALSCKPGNLRSVGMLQI